MGPVFSEKMKNASTHHEIEYAEFIKSKLSCVLNGRAVVRIIDMRWIKKFRCNTVDLPYRGVRRWVVARRGEKKKAKVANLRFPVDNASRRAPA